MKRMIGAQCARSVVHCALVGSLLLVGCTEDDGSGNTGVTGSLFEGGATAGTATAGTTGDTTSTTADTAGATTGTTGVATGTTAATSGATGLTTGTATTGTTGATTGTTADTTGDTGGDTGGETGDDTGGDDGGTSGLGGDCCDDGDCLCHGPAPSGLTSDDGPFAVQSYSISTGTVHYPTDAEPPFAAIALCGGFTNSGPEMADWGPFYASHGIVTVIVNTGPLDQPPTRGDKLLAAVEELKKENTASGSPLEGKLAGRYGTSGYSMGGGGTLLATKNDPSLYTSVGLAAWTTGTDASGVSVPTLLLCGSSDGTAPCRMSEAAYGQIGDGTDKMLLEIGGASHFAWFGPQGAGGGDSGAQALAFQKVFLEGDERWRDVLLSNGDAETNIK